MRCGSGGNRVRVSGGFTGDDFEREAANPGGNGSGIDFDGKRDDAEESLHGRKRAGLIGSGFFCGARFAEDGELPGGDPDADGAFAKTGNARAEPEVCAKHGAAVASGDEQLLLGGLPVFEFMPGSGAARDKDFVGAASDGGLNAAGLFLGGEFGDLNRLRVARMFAAGFGKHGVPLTTVLSCQPIDNAS